MLTDVRVSERAEQVEGLSEPELWEKRLKVVEEGSNQAGRRFLASLEIEAGMYLNSELFELIRSSDDEIESISDELDRRGTEVYLSDYMRSLPFLSREQRAEQDEFYRDAARRYVQAMPAVTIEQQITKDEWLKNIASFTTMDIINFRLYQEFSAPTLGSPAPPKGLDYEAMVKHSQAQGWLEFRFGNGILQSGYYDAPKTSEFRFMPCAPSELVEREAIVKRRFIQIAAEHGAIIRSMNPHFNVSVYEADTDNPDVYMPIVGRQPQRQAKTMDVVSGLCAAIEDGVWMTQDKAGNVSNFGVLGLNNNIKITTHRDKIRIEEDYFELREEDWTGSKAHGLLWLMAAVNHGLDAGREAIAQNGHNVAEVVNAVTVDRTASFVKEIDLTLQRLLEKSTIDEFGIPVIPRASLITLGPKFMKRYLGDACPNNIDLGFPFATMLTASLVIGENGQLSINQDRYQALFNSISKIEFESGLDISSLGSSEIMAKAETQVNRDALRIKMREVINANPIYPGLSPDDWRDRWLDSPVFRAMYGEQANSYAAKLHKIAQKDYVHLEPGSREHVDAMVADIARQVEALRR